MMKRTLIPALSLAAAAAAPATSMAEVTGNIGFSTEYVFRGIFQEESSAYAGADFTTENGFYLGTWWADVGDGTETDIYLGYNFGGENLTFKVGYTGYLYLDDFDGDYNEINLGLYAGIFALDVAVGEYDAGELFGLDDQDYTFTSITISPEVGPYYKYGMFSGDFADNILPLITTSGSDDGDYLEVGYIWSFEDQGIDFSAALIHSSDLPVVAGAGALDTEYALTFGIKKTFAP